jgi:hypothetical protein
MTHRCPNCNQPLPPVPRGIQTHSATRLGGRQVSLGRGVRVLAGFLADEGLYSEARAHKVALRVLSRALPAKQRHPRARVVEWREAA